ncbi:MAG: DUF456 domain-containing protein [Elusimicrobia bacterium]|nr:DUF456 domain-containing protein [Elusimicrobiota bacterium]
MRRPLLHAAAAILLASSALAAASPEKWSEVVPSNPYVQDLVRKECPGGLAVDKAELAPAPLPPASGFWGKVGRTLKEGGRAVNYDNGFFVPLQCLDAAKRIKGVSTVQLHYYIEPAGLKDRYRLFGPGRDPYGELSFQPLTVETKPAPLPRPKPKAPHRGRRPRPTHRTHVPLPPVRPSTPPAKAPPAKVPPAKAPPAKAPPAKAPLAWPKTADEFNRLSQNDRERLCDAYRRNDTSLLDAAPGCNPTQELAAVAAANKSCARQFANLKGADRASQQEACVSQTKAKACGSGPGANSAPPAQASFPSWAKDVCKAPPAMDKGPKPNDGKTDLNLKGPPLPGGSKPGPDTTTQAPKKTMSPETVANIEAGVIGAATGGMFGFTMLGAMFGGPLGFLIGAAIGGGVFYGANAWLQKH